MWERRSLATLETVYYLVGRRLTPWKWTRESYERPSRGPTFMTSWFPIINDIPKRSFAEKGISFGKLNIYKTPFIRSILFLIITFYVQAASDGVFYLIFPFQHYDSVPRVPTIYLFSLTTWRNAVKISFFPFISFLYFSASYHRICFAV